MFRHRSARLLMCKRAQFHHAIAMTQIYSQEMSEVFQFSYFDMEDTFSSFGTVAHYFFCFIVGLSDSLKQWIFRDKCANEGLFVSYERRKKHLHFAIPDTIRFDWPSVGWSAFIRLISCYYVLFDPRTKALLSNTYSTHTESVRKRAREREDVGLYRKFMARYSWPINSHISSTISNEKQTDNKNKTTATKATNILTKLSNAQFMYIHVIHFYRGCLGHQKWNN